MHSKEIKVFISSTFSDMHRERDILHLVEAQLNQDLSDTGYRISFVDLRLGIDTTKFTSEEAIEHYILERCFDEIARCQLFVLLVGSRYGSIFRNAECGVHLSAEEAAGKSVTHLELLYGCKRMRGSRMLVMHRMLQVTEDCVPGYLMDSAESQYRISEMSNHLRRMGCREDTYTAAFRNGSLSIDEYYFRKHALAILEDMVRSYIAETAAIGRDTAALIDTNPLVLQTIAEKCDSLPPEHRKLFRTMLEFLSGGLMTEADFSQIHAMGADGNAQVEYILNLLRRIPNDVDAAMECICQKIAQIHTDTSPESTLSALRILAHAGSRGLFDGGILTGRELIWILEKESKQTSLSYGDYLELGTVFKNSYRPPAPLETALQLFSSSGLLEQLPRGFCFSDTDLEAHLSGQCSSEEISRIEGYYAKSWWYRDDRITAALQLLLRGEYALFTLATEKNWFCSQFTDGLVHALKKYPLETVAGVIGDFCSWCMAHTIPHELLLCLLLVVFPQYCNLVNEEDRAEPLLEDMCFRYHQYMSVQPQNPINCYIIALLNGQIFAAGQDSNCLSEALVSVLPEMLYAHEQGDFFGTYGSALLQLVDIFRDREQLAAALRIACIQTSGIDIMLPDIFWNILPLYTSGLLTDQQLRTLLVQVSQVLHREENCVRAMLSAMSDMIFSAISEENYVIAGHLLYIWCQYASDEARITLSEPIQWDSIAAVQTIFEATQDSFAASLLEQLYRKVGTPAVSLSVPIEKCIQLTVDKYITHKPMPAGTSDEKET